MRNLASPTRATSRPIFNATTAVPSCRERFRGSRSPDDRAARPRHTCPGPEANWRGCCNPKQRGDGPCRGRHGAKSSLRAFPAASGGVRCRSSPASNEAPEKRVIMRTACYRLLLVVIWISGAVLALGYLLHDGPALKLLLVSGAFMRPRSPRSRSPRKRPRSWGVGLPTPAASFSLTIAI